METLALVAENELLRIENERLTKMCITNKVRCPYTTLKGIQCKNLYGKCTSKHGSQLK
jgi:hypothetical protein